MDEPENKYGRPRASVAVSVNVTRGWHGASAARCRVRLPEREVDALLHRVILAPQRRH